MFHQDPNCFDTAQLIAPRATPVLRGLTGATLLETDQGWRPVDALTVGDAVYTFDGGLRRIEAVRRHFLTAAALADCGARPVRIAGGTMDACSDLVLMPGQGVLRPTDARRAGGGEHLLVAARDLTAMPGVAPWARQAPLALTELGFAEEEVVWANSGVLLHCPAAGAWAAPWGIYRADPAPAAARPVAAPALVAA